MEDSPFQSIRELIHSIRNPLSAIISNIELLLGGYIPNIDNETLLILKEISFNSEYMRIILDNSADVAKIKTIDDVIPEKINISSIIREVLEMLKIINQNIENIIIFKSGKECTMIGNQDMFKRFFLIIIYQLFKFNCETIILNIECEKQDKMLSIAMFYDIKDKTTLFNAKNIFTELFTHPKSKSNAMNSAYFYKLLDLFNGETEIKIEDGITKWLTRFMIA